MDTIFESYQASLTEAKVVVQGEKDLEPVNVQGDKKTESIKITTEGDNKWINIHKSEVDGLIKALQKLKSTI